MAKKRAVKKGVVRQAQKKRGRRHSSRHRRITSGLPVIPEQFEHYFFEHEGHPKSAAVFTALTLGRKVPGLERGLQSRVTEEVKRFAAQFPLDPKLPRQQALEEMVKRMVERIARLPLDPLKPSEAELLYGKRTAEDILASKRIPSVTPKETGLPSWGCSEMVTALAAALRAKGIKTSYVRTVFKWWHPAESSFPRPHSVAFFKLGNREFIADPFLLSQNEASRETPLVWQVGENLRGQIEGLKRKGWWVVGWDAWSLGIKTFWDYNKFINPDKFKHDQIAFQAYLKDFQRKPEEKKGE